MYLFKTVCAAVGGIAIGAAAAAAPIDPTIGTFGDLASVGSNVTFGGTGIPTEPANFDTFTDGEGNTLVLGVSATPRFSAPTPTNDGDGTYQVIPGVDSNGISFWNFNYYAELILANGSMKTLGNIGLQFLYDLDPAMGTDSADLGVFDFTGLPSLTTQGSQNATFGFLSSTVVPGLTPPSVSNFNPNGGEYSFAFRATDFSQASAIGVGINVSVVPLPAGPMLLLSGLGCLYFMRRRRNVTA